jgi:hypothetical protein
MRTSLAVVATLLVIASSERSTFGQAPASAKVLGFAQQSQPPQPAPKNVEHPSEPVQQAVFFVPQEALVPDVQLVTYGQQFAHGNCPPGYGYGPGHHGHAGHHHGYGGRPGHILHGGRYGYFGGAHRTPGYPHHHLHREYVGPQGPPTAQVAYPYYTIRGPRDFLLDNPPSIGR